MKVKVNECVYIEEINQNDSHDNLTDPVSVLKKHKSHPKVKRCFKVLRGCDDCSQD